MGASIKFSRTLMEVPIKLLGALVVIFFWMLQAPIYAFCEVVPVPRLS